MNELKKQFRQWCEGKGMLVVSIRKTKFGTLRAFLANFYGEGRANIADLHPSGGIALYNTESGSECWVGRESLSTN